MIAIRKTVGLQLQEDEDRDCMPDDSRHMFLRRRTKFLAAVNLSLQSL